MSQQLINIGAYANDKSGDPVRVAFNKVNQNFQELYNTIGATGFIGLGPTGATGPRGATGPQGFRGATGSNGPKG